MKIKLLVYKSGNENHTYTSATKTVFNTIEEQNRVTKSPLYHNIK